MTKKQIRLTLDTSAIDLQNPCLKTLTEMQKNGAIEIYIENYQCIEKCQWHDSENKDKTIEWINRYTKTPIEAFLLAEGAEFPNKVNLELETEQKIELKVRRIHSPEVQTLECCKLSKYTDFRILTAHIKNCRDYFITNNSKDFINFGKQKNERRKQFESTFVGLKIRQLNSEVIEELKKEISNRVVIL